MFDGGELQKLRQDIDALGAQFDVLQNTLEARHQELMERIAVIDEQQKAIIESGLSDDDIDAIREALASQPEVLDDDELYEQAKDLVMEMGSASTLFLQRTLGIGYSRAVKVMDAFEANGVIGPADGSAPRKVIG